MGSPLRLSEGKHWPRQGGAACSSLSDDAQCSHFICGECVPMCARQGQVGQNQSRSRHGPPMCFLLVPVGVTLVKWFKWCVFSVFFLGWFLLNVFCRKDDLMVDPTSPFALFLNSPAGVLFPWASERLQGTKIFQYKSPHVSARLLIPIIDVFSSTDRSRS